MEISHPRRILILSQPETDISPVLLSLVPKQEKPGLSSTSTTSTSRPVPPDAEPIHHIKTAYYSASIPIWTDRISNVSDWAAEWKAIDGASEVIRAVGAWICIFERPRTQDDMAEIRSLLRDIASVITHCAEQDPYADIDSDGVGAGGDALLLAVGLPQHQLPALDLSDAEWEDMGREVGGWEYIDVEAQGKNEYGELRGLPRLLEALESAEWDAGGDGLDGADIDQDFDAAFLGDLSEFNGEMNDLLAEGDEATLESLLKSRSEEDWLHRVRDPDDGHDVGDKDTTESEVEDLQRMLLKLQAARDLGADLPQTERRRLAAKAVKDVMEM